MKTEIRMTFHKETKRTYVYVADDAVSAPIESVYIQKHGLLIHGGKPEKIKLTLETPEA